MTGKLYLFPLSDIHLGSQSCNLDFFYRWCKEFEKAPDNKAIYLLGDMLEFPTTRIDAYSVSLTTHEALERLIELLSPYKEYVRFVATGNHENRSFKEFNYDITKSIASRLDAKYTHNDFFDKIIEGGKEFVVYGKHGTKTSKHPQLAMKNFMTDMGDIDADLYLQGHNHYCEFVSKYQRDYDDGKRKYYAFTGHFLNYDGYARDKGFLLSQPSFLRLTIDKKLHVDAKKYYYDEVI